MPKSNQTKKIECIRLFQKIKYTCSGRESHSPFHESRFIRITIFLEWPHSGIPIRNIESSIQFYQETLSCTLDWGGSEGETVCLLSRDGYSVMLSQTIKDGSVAWIWLGLDDDSLFDIYKTSRAKVLQEPKNYPWACEMKIEGIDGNVLWLGTGPRNWASELGLGKTWHLKSKAIPEK